VRRSDGRLPGSWLAAGEEFWAKELHGFAGRVRELALLGGRQVGEAFCEHGSSAVAELADHLLSVRGEFDADYTSVLAASRASHEAPGFETVDESGDIRLVAGEQRGEAAGGASPVAEGADQLDLLWREVEFAADTST
jgi:hypothetical protein